MKLLVDESIARRVALLLVEAGHDAIHVSDRDLLGVPDEAILDAAAQDTRTVITADTDFGTLLALGHTAQPSVILLRRPGRRAEQRAAAITEAISTVGDALGQGAMVVIEPHRLRVRALPIQAD